MAEQFRIKNEHYPREDVPLSARALANLQALEETDDLHEYGSGTFKRPKRFEPESVYRRVREWISGGDDIWRANGALMKEMPRRATCLEQHPALAVHIAVLAPYIGARAGRAEMALDAGKSLEEVARIAKFDIPAHIDPRLLRVVKNGKRFKVTVEYPKEHWR
jgi:hypothetical protein